MWDVTDKDIDLFAETVFAKTGLKDNATPKSSTAQNLTRAVATSREVCKLKYLNGAAPVVYGIPCIFV